MKYLIFITSIIFMNIFIVFNVNSDEFDEFWDNLVSATFDSLRVLHTQHPYRRLDGTFCLKENGLKFVSSYACY